MAALPSETAPVPAAIELAMPSWKRSLHITRCVRSDTSAVMASRLRGFTTTTVSRMPARPRSPSPLRPCAPTSGPPRLSLRLGSFYSDLALMRRRSGDARSAILLRDRRSHELE
jgi:hypothetical protein